MPTKIRQVTISAFGDLSNVAIVDSEMPDPPTDHVQVKVIYSGFFASDINMRLGLYPMQKRLLSRLDTVIGSTKFHAGDLVAGLTKYDSEAELINQPEKYVIPLPPGMDLQKACAMIVNWTTAYGMVKRAADVKKQQKVFVHGMSGAVGNALVELCLLRGASVYGTASASSHAAIIKAGATPFLYTDKVWMTKMKELGGADVVFDALGFDSWDESFSILSHTGLLVGYGGNLLTLNDQPARSVVWPTVKLLSHNLALWSKKQTSFFYIDRDQKTFEPELRELFKMLQDGTIKVPIKSIFALENIHDAHRSWGKAGGIGSMLIKVSDEPQ